VQMAARSALQLGMLNARLDADFSSAMATFSAGALYAPELIALATAKVALEADFFEAPIYCCLLASKQREAEDLARSLSAIPVSGDLSWFELSARLLAAFVLKDEERFDSLIQYSDKVEKNYRQRQLEIYFQMYRAVLARDQALYDRLMQEANDKFKARAKDKQFGDELSEYGGLQENAFVLDFMSLGVASIARRLSLTNSLNSEYFPQTLLEKIVSGSR
jgi:hypothetical protein